MGKWVTTLKLTPEWLKAQDDELATSELAKIIAQRVRALPVPTQFEDSRNELADDFAALANDEDVDVEDFDALMAELYDWADIKIGTAWPPTTLCWVETMR